jgi:hypothetical protein
MGSHRWLIGIALVGLTSVSFAQGSPGRDPLLYEPPVPAQAILALRDDLQLTESQISKLTTLATTQLAALSRATAAFLRADADLLDASRADDLVIHRLALEKRAKIAIDAEVARLQAQKNASALLTDQQRTKLAEVTRPQQAGWVASDATVWQPLVSPPRLSRVRPAEPVDSGEIRVSVSPSYAEIYLDGQMIGLGRKFTRLPVGSHELRLQAPGCTEVKMTIQVEKSSVQLIPPQKLICSQ